MRAYFTESKRLGVSALAVLPLLVLYEGGRLVAHPGIRNGADALLRRCFDLLGPFGTRIWWGVVGCCAVAAAVTVVRRKPTWRVMALPLEGLCYGGLLVPLMMGLAGMMRAVAMASPIADIPLAMGAGIYEEILFRLMLLPLLYVLLRWTLGFLGGTHKSVALGLALLLSSIAFASFHHVGGTGEGLVWGVFWFRAAAGAVLGMLFLARGFGVAAWTHAGYDIAVVLLP